MAVETSRISARAAFMALVDVHGNDLPLDQAVAWIDAEERGLDSIDSIIAALDGLADGLHLPEGSTLFESIARLNHHLFQEHGFEGDKDEYDSPDNSLISKVIERRKGLPILLSVVYMELARRVGISIDGIGFPTHFMVSPSGADPRFFIDPFHQGEVMRREQMRRWFERLAHHHQGTLRSFGAWIHPVNNRIILVRMNNNLKASCMRRGDLEGALRAVERLLILMPDALDARRDRGLLRLELGDEEEGAKDVDAYLAACGQVERAAQD